MAAKVVAGITVESSPTPQQLDAMKVKTWDIWTKEPSTFDWHYDEPEACYFLAGDVTIQTAQGDVQIKKGDLVTFPKGLSCTWVVKGAVRKHYKFG